MRWLRALLAGSAACLAATAADGGESLAPMGTGRTGSERIVTQREWAAELVEVLGLTDALPTEVDDRDLFGLLCADDVELITESGGRRVPRGSPFRVSVEAPRRRKPTDPVRVVLSVPVTALYQLSVEGVGRQRWVVDQRLVGHLDLSPLGVAHAPAIVPLRHGPHELSAYLGNLARVARVTLTGYRALCIAPAEGWRGDEPLTYGAKARTLVRAFDFERLLPEAEESVRIEGEQFASVTAGGGPTTRRLDQRASADLWAAATSGPAEFTYRLRLKDPGLFTFTARLHGERSQIWSIDGRYRVTVNPEQTSSSFAWTHVITIPLAAGEHAVRALVPRSAGIDVIRVVKRRANEEDYVAMLEDVGFGGGAPGQLVPRSDLRRDLSSRSFSLLATDFQHRLAGKLETDPIALVDLTPLPGTSRPVSPVLPADL